MGLKTGTSDLPQEIWQHILSYLPCRDLAQHVTLVSSDFRDYARELISFAMVIDPSDKWFDWRWQSASLEQKRSLEQAIQVQQSSLRVLVLGSHSYIWASEDDLLSVGIRAIEQCKQLIVFDEAVATVSHPIKLKFEALPSMLEILRSDSGLHIIPYLDMLPNLRLLSCTVYCERLVGNDILYNKMSCLKKLQAAILQLNHTNNQMRTFKQITQVLPALPHLRYLELSFDSDYYVNDHFMHPNRDLERAVLMLEELQVLKLKDLYDLDSISLSDLRHHPSLKRVYVAGNSGTWTGLQRILSFLPQLVELGIYERSGAHSSPVVRRHVQEDHQMEDAAVRAFCSDFLEAQVSMEELQEILDLFAKRLFSLKITLAQGITAQATEDRAANRSIEVVFWNEAWADQEPLAKTILEGQGFALDTTACKAPRGSMRITARKQSQDVLIDSTHTSIRDIMAPPLSYVLDAIVNGGNKELAYRTYVSQYAT